MTELQQVADSPPTKRRAGSAVARNTFWYGLEVFLSVIAAFIASVAVARHFGPTTLGYYNFVLWLTNTTGLVGTLGLPLATRKYMAEYLGRGQPGVARAIYERMFRVQALISCGLALTGGLIAWTAADPAFRWIALLLCAGILPRTLAFIPSCANLAFEDTQRNVLGAVVGFALQLSAIAITLAMRGSLLGVAFGVFIGSCAELLLKMRSVGWVRSASVEPIPADLQRRIFAFSRQSVALMLLDIVIWERSDVVILKLLNPDVRQVAFFSVAFSVCERILLAPQVLAGAIGVTVMAQFDRDRARTMQMTVASLKYLVFCSIPLLVGIASISRPLTLLIYGHEYAPVIPVLTVVALFAIPKAVLSPVQVLLQASDNQRVLVWLGCCCGIVNVALDVALVRSFGAMGAAVANGVAQTAMLVGMWVYAGRVFRMELPIAGLVRLAASAGVMGIGVFLLTSWVPGWHGLVAGIIAGALTFLLMVRWTGAIEKSDVDRLLGSRFGTNSGLGWALARMVKA